MRLWLSSFIRRLAQGKLQEENLVLFLLDEVGNLGPMPILKEALTVLRSYGIRLYLFLQALGQLHSLFPGPKEFQTVQASIDTQLYFGIRDRETAEEVSAIIGDMTTTSLSEGTSKSRSTPTMTAIFFGGSLASEQVSESTNITHTEVGRRLLKPEEILQLPERAVLILNKRTPPIAAHLVRYYQDEEFAGLAVPARPDDEEEPSQAICTDASGWFQDHPALPEPEEAVACAVGRKEERPPAHRELPAPAPAVRLAKCPACKRGLRIPAKAAGGKGKCSGCGQRFQIRDR